MADTVRTVSVTLKMQITDFEAGAAKATVVMEGLSAEVDNFGKKSKGAGDEVDNFGKKSKTGFDGASKASTDFSRNVTSNLKDGETAFQSLTARSKELGGEVDKLRRNFATTGDKSVFGDLKTAENDLKNVNGVLKDMGGNIKKAESGSQDLQGLLIQMGIAAAPFLVPVAAGTLLGVLGAGGLALGIAGQLHNADVKVAIGGLGQDISTTLTKATAPFGPELTKSIGILDAGVTGFLNSLQPAFKALAPELSIFTKTVSGGLLTAGPLFANAMARSRPDVQALGQLIADLSVGTGEFFNNLSIGAEGGATAINALGTELKNLEANLGTDLGVISQMVGQLGTAEQATNDWTHSNSILNSTFGAVVDAAKSTLDPMVQIQNAQDAINKVFHTGSGAADSFDGSVQALTGNVTEALSPAQALAGAFDDLAKSMDSAFNTAMNLDQANLGLKQAQADLTSTLKKNKDAWSQNTQAGRDDWTQLLNNLSAIQKVHDAQVASTGATAKNTAAYYKNVDSLLALAQKAGLSKTAVAQLRDQFERLPDNKQTTVTAPNLSRVLSDAGAYRTTLSNIPHNVSTNVVTHYSHTGNASPLHPSASRWGNLYEPAADGLLTHAQVYTPVNPGRFMIAEPQTGGEAFVPKNGDYGRSMSILSAAAGWYGAHVVAGNNGGGGGGTVVELRAAPGDQAAEALLSMLRPTVRGRYNGSAQLAVGAG